MIYTLYPVVYTLYPLLYTLYPLPYTLYPLPYTLFLIPHTQSSSHCVCLLCIQGRTDSPGTLLKSAKHKRQTHNKYLSDGFSSQPRLNRPLIISFLDCIVFYLSDGQTAGCRLLPMPPLRPGHRYAAERSIS